MPRLGAATQRRTSEVLVDADLGTFATALCARTDDLVKAAPQRAPERPEIGVEPKLTDVELITLAVLQALAGRPSAPAGCATPTPNCGTCSPTCPSSRATPSACRPCLVETIRWLIGVLAGDTSLFTDDGWVVPSAPRLRPLTPWNGSSSRRPACAR